MEHRKGDALRSTPLPFDYLRMVEEVFTTNFDAGLKKLEKLGMGELSISASGAIYSNEIVLSVSLLEKGQLAATTAYASADFDPKASTPTIQELLAVCVDAAGTVFGQLLDAEDDNRLEQIAAASLSAMDDIPFEWTQLKLDRFRLFLKVDKANPKLDQLADEWLNKNDPDFERRQREEEEETKKLFVTGPVPGAKTSRGSGSGGLH